LPGCLKTRDYQERAALRGSAGNKNSLNGCVPLGDQEYMIENRSISVFPGHAALRE